MAKIAVYAGSFDPFTNGHLSIVKEAAEIFDKVYICIAVNANKQRFTSQDAMKMAISKCLQNNGLNNCIVIGWSGLVAEACRKLDAKYLIRGLRGTSDYLYEETIAKINKEINPDLKTVYFRAENDVVSSSLVRELLKYEKKIDKYVPEDVLSVLQECNI